MSEKFEKYYRRIKGLGKEVEGGILNIGGGAYITGGKYKEINISGGATVDGDVEAERISVSGGATVRGKLNVGILRVSGGVTAHSINCEIAEVAGGLSIRGGSLKAKTAVIIKGGLKVDGDLEAGGHIDVYGGLVVGGKLNTGRLVVRLGGGNSEVKSGIEANYVKVYTVETRFKQGILKRIYSYLPFRRGKLYTKYIKAKIVEIENTICDYIEADSIYIGPGCVVREEVIYHNNYECSKDSNVNKVMRT